VELALRTVHLLAAAVWVGGTIALAFAAVPPLQRLEGPERARLLRELGERWRPIGWGSLVVAIATGAAIAGREHAFDTTPTDFDVVLAVKGALVGLLVAGAYLHDFVLGPGLARQIREAKPQSRRRVLVGIGRANLLLTIAIPVLGVALSQLLDR
jgi:uncharacterized membrane protein